ncbi:MAG: RidA family protein [Gemmatimonadota bacterium]
MPFHIINPESLVEPRGWNHGLLAPESGGILFVAGQTAMDREGAICGDFVEQFGRALEAVLDVVREAGGGAKDIGRMTVFVADMDAYQSSRKALGKAYRERMGSHYPAMALVEVSRLVDRGALVEIEATAVIHS